jgi:phosphatidate cytidylyltransferase
MKIRVLAGFCIALVLLLALLFLPHPVVSALYILICAFAACEIAFAEVYSAQDASSKICWVEYCMIGFSAMAVTLAFDNFMAGYIIILCALMDVGGFATGKLLRGKAHKVALLKNISPNKSWEGYIVGTICSIGLGACFYWPMRDYLPANTFWFAFVAWIAAIMGDLFESALKRQLGVKDSADRIMSSRAKLLKLAEKPIRSHGGYLDRIDSFIFASVAYVVFNSFWH